MMVSVLCWPVGWLAKCHTKMCLFLLNNVVSHMTYVAAANRLAELMIVVMCIQVCPVF